jgi:hypothetical protein
VAVGVDEAREQGPAAEVHEPRRAALVSLLYLGIRPDREDLPVLDGQRLGARPGGGPCVNLERRAAPEALTRILSLLE